MLKKPKKLQSGDKIATVSPSSGVAGDPVTKWRYEQGVKRLENEFGLEVIAMPNSLKGTDYLYENPQARAEDLMRAFKDESIKGIIANVGGKDCIQLLPCKYNYPTKTIRLKMNDSNLENRITP